MPHIGFIKCTTGNTGSTGTAVIHPEVVAFLRVTIKFLDTQVIVPGVAGFVRMFVVWFETVTTVFGFHLGNGFGRTCICTFATLQTEIGNTPFVWLIIFDEFKIRALSKTPL